MRAAKTNLSKQMKTSIVAQDNSSSDDAYEKFLEGLELITLALTGSSSYVDRDALFRAYKNKLVRRFNSNYSLVHHKVNAFDCEAKFSLTVIDPKSAEKPLLTVEVRYKVHMHGPPKTERRLAERFCYTDLKFILLPYARHFVSDITAQMSVPPEVVPLGMHARSDSSSKKR